MKKIQVKNRLIDVEYDGKHTIEYTFMCDTLLDDHVESSSAFRVDKCMGKFIEDAWLTPSVFKKWHMFAIGIFFGSLMATIIHSVV